MAAGRRSNPPPLSRPRRGAPPPTSRPRRDSTHGPDAGAKSERLRVLCVDDDELVVAGMQAALSKHFDVTVAGSGADALKLLTRERFDVVVSDFIMPDMSGAEFLSQVRNAGRILITGQADTDAVIEAVNTANVHRFATKPCTPEVLANLIRETAARETSEQSSPSHNPDQAAQAELESLRALASIGRLARPMVRGLSSLSLDAHALLDRIGEQLSPEDSEALRSIAKRTRSAANRLEGIATRGHVAEETDRKALFGLEQEQGSLPQQPRQTDPDILSSQDPPSPGPEGSADRKRRRRRRGY